MRNRLHALACMALVCLGTSARAAEDDAGAQNAAPILPAEARQIEELIDDQGELHFVISYPALAGMPAHRSEFTHAEDQAAVNITGCTIVTRVVRQRDSVPAAHFRAVVALSDVIHMQIMSMSAFSSSFGNRSAAPGAAPSNMAEPDIPVVVLDERDSTQTSVFTFRSIEPARRFLAILQRVVPRCGGRND